MCDEMEQAHISVPLSFLLLFNPRSLEENIVTRSLGGGGGGNRIPPSTFDTIHPIDMKLGTYNKLHLCFQSSDTTWFLMVSMATMVN